MKKVLLVLLLFLPVLLLTAQQRNNFNEFVVEIWQVNQRQAAVIINYQGTSTHIVIPEQINGYPVAGIGTNAFRARHIESVQFPRTLVFVGEYAFYGNRLYGINLPSSVTTIGVGAFDNNSPAMGIPPSSGSTTYTRAVTIEPAHSSSRVYISPKPAASLPRTQTGNVRSVAIEPAHSNSRVYISPKPAVSPSQAANNILVVPGYNPVDSARQSYPLAGSVTTILDYTPTTNLAPASSYSTHTYFVPVPEETAAPQTPYVLVPDTKNVAVSRRNRYMLVPEATVDKDPERSIIAAPDMQLYKEEIQQLWQQPRRR
jgi:hypothetical protein